MKSELCKGVTLEIYESPIILYKEIMTVGFLCISSDDYGSYINDAGQEEEDIFGTTLQL